jgi:hypothetical protein
VVTAEDASILPSLTGTSGVLTGTGTAAAAIDVFAAAIAAQEALNGSPPRAIVVLYRRGGVNVDIGFDGGDFMTNQRTMRLEERFATAVVRPARLTSHADLIRLPHVRQTP